MIDGGMKAQRKVELISKNFNQTASTLDMWCSEIWSQGV